MQIRLDKETLKEEREAFAEYAGVDVNQIDTLNIFTTPNFDPSILDGYDAFFVGGSSDEGDALVIENKPEFACNSMRILKTAYEKKMPVFASCYGFQAAVVALGGELVHDVSRAEKGTPLIHVTTAGQADAVFKDIPEAFHAISVHEKMATKLPKGAITLAETEVCPYHAFTFRDRPFYAFQFHPEVDLRELTVRLKRYQDRYMESDGAFDELIQQAKDTPYSNALVTHFIDRVVLGSTSNRGV